MTRETQTVTVKTLPHAAGVAALLIPLYVLAYTLGSFDNPIGEVGDLLLLLLPLLLVSGLTAALVRSDTVKQALLKILLSLPFTLGFWFWMRDAQLLLRALNWAAPGYGALSAGGAFAAFLQLAVIAAGHLAGMLIGIAVTREQSRPALWNGICCAAYVVCPLVTLAFFTLSFALPPYFGEVG